jgi:hypothetical protein
MTTMMNMMAMMLTVMMKIMMMTSRAIAPVVL